MKSKLVLGILIGLFAAASYAAPQVPPKDDEGTVLSDAIAKRFGLPTGGACRVALPDPAGKVARVARVAARMSVWVANQEPADKEPPLVYLHREGDDRVLLRGPAINAVNMGPIGDVAIMQEEGKRIPIGIIDHTELVHWVSLANFGEERDKIKEYKDGLGDLGMLDKSSFTVRHARLYPAKPFKKPELKEGTYTVTVLMINFLGRVRAFGVCM